MVKKVNFKDANEKLQKAYDLAITAKDDFGFYINLVNYLSLFEQLPELQEFVKGYILKVADKDNELLHKLEKEIIGDVWTVFGRIKPFVIANKIENPELQEDLKQIEDLYADKAFSSNGKMHGMHGNLNRVLYILWDLEDGKHREFLKQFGDSRKNGDIYWKTTGKVEDYDVEELRMKRIGLVKIWHYWDKLGFYYNLFAEYEKMSKEWFDQGSYMTLVGVKDAYNELAKPLGLLDRHQKVDDISYFFKKDEMFNTLRQFHYHFQGALDLNKNQELKKSHAMWDNSQKVISVEDVTISFKGSKRADLLALLFKERRKLYFDECLKHIEGIDTESCSSKDLKGYKKNFLNYCSGVNSRLAENGFLEFLTFDTNAVQISSVYR